MTVRKHIGELRVELRTFRAQNTRHVGYPPAFKPTHSTVTSVQGLLMWITGQVVDDRGEPLAGVTVEVSGPAPAAKKAFVTNGRGQYVMQDLRPGVYTLTFARSGFSTVHRTSIELSTFVAIVNAKLTGCGV